MRELVVLGTASQAPTRMRNHNGYLLRWDGEGILFDPGEGTQRQLAHAGIAASEITRMCITHFHGDHALGVPGIVQRLSLDRVAHPVSAHYPASGADFFERLRHATPFYETAVLLGSGELVTSLLPHGLIDEFKLLIHPLVIGEGRHLFPDGGPEVSLRLIDAEATSTGVVLATYRP